MLCCEWTLIKSFAGALTAQPLKCRRWSCDYCQPFRASDLKRDALAGRPNTFLTLTVNPNVGLSPDDRARSLVHAWRLLRLRLIRKYKLASLPFLAVFEATKAGEPHLHILLRSEWLSQKYMSEVMAELISAPIVDVRRIKSAAQIANYVGKYVGKDPHAFQGTKRYWSSRDYCVAQPDDGLAPDVAPPIFWIVRESIERWLSRAAKNCIVPVSIRGPCYTVSYDRLLAHERWPR